VEARRGQKGIIKEDEIMRRLLFAASIFAALVITIGVFAVHAKTEPKKTEKATVEFKQQVKLLNVFLKGEYLIVHDEEKMAKGLDCTYVYDRTGKLVVSFHCIPVERKMAKGFRVVLARVDNATALDEIREIQFEGSTEAHQVP